MYDYKLNIPATEYDYFVANHPQANLFQSSQWAIVKDDWKNQRLGIYRDNKLEAVASLLIRPIALGYTMIYIPRGPIMDYQDQDLVVFTLTTLKKIAKSFKTLFVKFDPLLFLATKDSDGNFEDNDNQSIIDTLTDFGCEWVGRTLDMAETIQPRFQANIYEDRFTLENLSKNVRQSIRTSQNKGVTVTFGGPELLNDFAELMKKTEDRKSIHLRNKDYYQKMMTAYPDHSFITMAFLDLSNRHQVLTTQLEQAKATLANYTDKTKPGKIENTKNEIKRFQEELEFLTPWINQGTTKVPLAATLSLEFAQTSENLYAGMDDTFRRYQAPLFVWYETARHSFERGNKWLNLGGVENQLDGGLYAFKSKFNPTIEEFIGEFNLPTSPLYKLTNLAYKIRKRLRSNH